MKVYVLIHELYSYDYDCCGSSVINVCADLESAMKYVKENYEIIGEFKQVNDSSHPGWSVEVEASDCGDEAFIGIDEFEVLN